MAHYACYVKDGREYRQSIPAGNYGRGHIVTTGYGAYRITGEPHHESYGYLWRAVDVSWPAEPIDPKGIPTHLTRGRD